MPSHLCRGEYNLEVGIRASLDRKNESQLRLRSKVCRHSQFALKKGLEIEDGVLLWKISMNMQLTGYLPYPFSLLSVSKKVSEQSGAVIVD